MILSLIGGFAGIGVLVWMIYNRGVNAAKKEIENYLREKGEQDAEIYKKVKINSIKSSASDLRDKLLKYARKED